MESIENTKQKAKGDAGEAFAEAWAMLNNFSFVKASRSDNIKKGVDHWIDNTPTDSKITNRIYLGNYREQDDKFIVRHPFRTNSEATHYLMIKPNKELNTISFTHEKINENLAKRFLNHVYGKKHLTEILEMFDKKSFKDFNLKSAKQMLFILKSKILSSNLIKESTIIKYDEKQLSLFITDKEIEQFIKNNKYY